MINNDRVMVAGKFYWELKKISMKFVYEMKMMIYVIRIADTIR